MKANYYVYLHESPSEKVYVGITRTSLRKRWQKGKGYLTGSQPLFEKAIRKYGWDIIVKKTGVIQLRKRSNTTNK